MEEHQPGSPPASGGRRLGFYAGVAAGILAVTAAVTAIIAGVGAATAQTSSPSPSSSVKSHEFPHRGFGKFGFGFGGRGVLHGQFTTPAPDGGYQTLAVQRGTVTSVGSSSITLKSEDGYTHTYAVDDNTLVNAGNDGIGDVSKDDVVQLVAVVDGSTSHAVQVLDITTIKELRGRWMPMPQPKQTASTSSSPAA
jgi:hypothetical protein